VGPVPRRVVVVGAGFGGIGAAVSLRRAGFDVVVHERAPTVGGTWQANTYPGCECDIPSVLYSFSFAPNPDWTRRYPAQPEIEAYLQRVVADHGLERVIRCGSEVTALVHRPGGWDVHLADGTAERADAVVLATGPLSRPAVPDLPGLDTFPGPVVHTARWDHGLRLGGRRVALVGTGASAVQVGPAIADRVGGLVVFQRTPPWVVPRDDRAVTPVARARRRRVPGAQRAERWAVYWRQEAIVGAYTGSAPWIRRRIADLARSHLAASVADPALRAALTPSYEPGCKRLLLSNDWYPTLLRPHVTLVPEAVAAVEGRALRTPSGRREEVDVVVLATGYDTRPSLAPMAVTGPDGRDLSDVWRAGAASHLGITVSGFPNLFLLAGPNTGLGHNSIVFMIEAQVRWVTAALSHLFRTGHATLELRPDAQTRSYARTQARMRSTVWDTGGCASWYRNNDGRIDAMWPWSSAAYWRRTRRFDPGPFALGGTAPPG
jgi:cation diffusion facilitator CzcD-associated flavoprotein CzcO